MTNIFSASAIMYKSTYSVLFLDQVLKITGNMYTGQIGRLSDSTGENFDPDAAEITRLVIILSILLNSFAYKVPVRCTLRKNL